MKKTLLGATIVAVAAVYVLPAHCLDIFEYWYNSVLPHYQFSIDDCSAMDGDAAVLLEPLSQDGGARIRIPCTDPGGGSFNIVCFFGCESALYESKSDSAALLCWDCRFGTENCEQLWNFVNYCTTCPELETASLPGISHSGLFFVENHNITDCYIPTGVTAKDDTGAFTLTDNCHYEQ